MSNKKTSSCKGLFKKIPSIDELYQILDIEKIQYPRNIIKAELRKTLRSIRKDIELKKINSNIKEETIIRSKRNIKVLTFQLLTTILLYKRKTIFRYNVLPSQHFINIYLI